MVASEERMCPYHREERDMEKQSWYAIRTLHNKASVVRTIAQHEHVECYTPQREVEEVVDGEVRLHRIDIMPSLLFLYTTPSFIGRLRVATNDNILPYSEPGTTKLYAIADAEMERFRFVARTAATTIEPIDGSTLDATARVRITGGIFRGMEGHIKRVHGTKRFVVSIEGVAAIATTYIPKEYIEKITLN